MDGTWDQNQDLVVLAVLERGRRGFVVVVVTSGFFPDGRPRGDVDFFWARTNWWTANSADAAADVSRRAVS